MKIAVLVTSYNRAATTIRGLASLFDAARRLDGPTVTVFLVDDASPDGTGAIVRQRFPEVRVIPGTGSLYWNRGMCRAYRQARDEDTWDAYLLFNDDVVLMPDALTRMCGAFASLNARAPAVIIGAMRASEKCETTYSGLTSIARFRPLGFRRVPLGTEIRECQTFNGNCVLVPGPAMDDVGGLDPAYHHSFGDIDLGLTLGKKGCKSYLLPEHVGFCDLNPPRRRPPMLQRLKGMFVPPHPVSDQLHMTFKHYPWPVAGVLAVIQVTRRLGSAIDPRGA